MSAGAGSSLMLIVQDRRPRYEIHLSASGALAIANTNMVVAKRELRKITARSYNFAVHSSTTQNEFLRDVQLVLGTKDFTKVVSHANAASTNSSLNLMVDRPLVGHYGWSSWAEFFNFMPRIESFCRLSNTESLWRDASTGDVDFLCQSVWSFAASANAVLQFEGSKKPRFIVCIGESNRLLDLREPGDGDLPVTWQERMLRDSAERAFGPELTRHERHMHRLYRLVCQKKWSPSVQHELRALLRRIGVPESDSLLEDGAQAVAAYLVASNIPLVGVNPLVVVNPHGWNLIKNQYWSMLESAEPSWKWKG